MLPWLTFILLAVATLASAILVISRRNPRASGVWLTITLAMVGGIYLMLHASWLFALQIILYAGGVAAWLRLASGLVKTDASAKPTRFNRRWKLATGVALALAAELGFAFCRGYRGLDLTRAVEAMPAAQPAGLAPGGNYVLPAEIAALLVLVAAVGLVIMTRKSLE